MIIVREFDEIYNELLTNHLNRSGNAAGTLLQIFYSGVAVVAWGCYRVCQYVSMQILPSSSNSEWIEKHAKARGLTKGSTETDDELLGRINDDILYPRAGGNVYDWPRWTKEVSYTHDEGQQTEWVETVKDVVVDENPRGGGSLNIVITSDNQTTGYEEVATSELVAAVVDYIETKRPLGIWDVEVIAASQLLVSVTVTVTASNFSAISDTIETQIENLLKSKLPGETLPQSQITSVVIECGANDVVVSLPASTVTPQNGPTSYQRIWPDTITVNES